MTIGKGGGVTEKERRKCEKENSCSHHIAFFAPAQCSSFNIPYHAVCVGRGGQGRLGEH